MSEEERGERAQFIEGEIVHKALPSGWHGNLELSVGSAIRATFRRKKKEDGTGGWWIQSETSVQYAKTRQILTHDLVGWRRENVSPEPKEYPVRQRPDWACEISVSTLKKDVRDVRRMLELEQVPFYWVVDAASERLLVFELRDGVLLQTKEFFKDDGMQRLPPFEAVEFSLGILFGDDEED